MTHHFQSLFAVMRRQRWLVLALILAGLAITVALSFTPAAPVTPAEHAADGDEHDEGAEVHLTAAQIAEAGITLDTAGAHRIQTRIELPGEIAANADRTAHVVPRLAGTVEQVAATLGQSVRQGEALAVLASVDLATLRSSCLSARQRLALARTTEAREQSLWQARISAEQDYLLARQARQEADIDDDRCTQQLLALDVSTDADGPLNRYVLRAPFDATVVERHLTLGETVAADTPVFTLVDLSTVWAEVSVPSRELANIRPDAPATVRATAFAAATDGRVSYIGALVDRQNRTTPARVTLANPQHLWRPGLFVTVAVTTGDETAAVTVANSAIQTLASGPVVFVRTDDGFVAQPVTLGRRDDNRTAITEGLAPGAVYADQGSFILQSALGKDSAEHSH